ncbi:BQ5605_C019g08862 [Microbotryum silenes-dioicae]|uniref:BQ5605_C019g08862 protein n=1 Tax=Microbotryum silenes-dioicae TaxID=796604 RepID=A0A2X0NZD8_9BASI|nr:BQ5605_C019g08862 [Microbotryum silenes-dioicae]
MPHDLHHNRRFLIHRRALPVLSDGAVVQGATPAVELTAPTFAADSGIVVASASGVDASSAVVGAADSVASTTFLTTTTTTTAPASPSATDGSFAISIIQDEPSVTSASTTTTTAAAASVFSAGPALISVSQDAPTGLSTVARDGLIVAIGLMLMAWVIYRGCRRRRARAALTASITSDSSSSLDGMSEKSRKVLFLSPPSQAKTTRDFKSSFDNYTATSPGLTTPAGWATFSNTSIPETMHTGVSTIPPLPQPQPSRWSASTYGDSRIPIRPTTPSAAPLSPTLSTPSTPPMGIPITIDPFDDRHIPPTPSTPSPSARGHSIKRKSPPMLPEIRVSVSDSESEEGDMGFTGTGFRPDYAMGTAAPVKAAEETLESPKSGSKIMRGTQTVLRVHNKGDVLDDEYGSPRCRE